jgi:hypothetical protein
LHESKRAVAREPNQDGTSVRQRRRERTSPCGRGNTALGGRRQQLTPPLEARQVESAPLAREQRVGVRLDRRYAVASDFAPKQRIQQSRMDAQSPMDAVIHVYTFKEGLLSKLAHDLLLNLTRFEIEAQSDTVHAVMDSASLEVVGAMREGVLQASVSESDKRTIQENMVQDVLRSKRFPQVRLTASVKRSDLAVDLHGTLELCGVSQPMRMTLLRRGGRLSGDFEFVPSRFGIKPYRALAGTLRVQDRVRISVDAQDPEGAAAAGVALRWLARA